MQSSKRYLRLWVRLSLLVAVFFRPILEMRIEYPFAIFTERSVRPIALKNWRLEVVNRLFGRNSSVFEVRICDRKLNVSTSGNVKLRLV